MGKNADTSFWVYLGLVMSENSLKGSEKFVDKVNGSESFLKKLRGLKILGHFPENTLGEYTDLKMPTP